MTLQATLQPFYQPYVDAGHLLHQYGVATYEAISSDRAKDIYKTVWILLQATYYLSILAGLYTIKWGQQFRGYYNAEWASDINRLIHWIATYSELPNIGTTTVTDDLDTETAAIPEALQTIVGSNSSTTNKLRKIATYYQISWRNSRGSGKHATNSTIREALQARCPEVLAAL